MMIDATNANVLVYANGLKSFPSAPIMENTGRKLITVVETAVMTAPLTSETAFNIKSLVLPFSFSRCRRIFSVTTIPISTIVPIAMAIPDKATIFASTLNNFIPIKTNSTVSGSMAEMSKEDRKCINIIRITIMVIRISSRKASFNVSSVSWISPVRS